MSVRSIVAAALLCLSVLTVAAEPTIFLIRHAEKAEGATGDAKDPDLSPAGRARADALALMLKDAGITSVFVTELRRTQQTAAPLARAADIQPTVVPAKETAALVDKLKEARGNVLVVGHSNTLPEIIRALGAPEPISIADEEYDNLFIWTGGAQPQLLRLRQPEGGTAKGKTLRD